MQNGRINDLFVSCPTPELTSRSGRSDAECFNSTAIGKAERSELQFISMELLNSNFSSFAQSREVDGATGI
jgi:hypothetical protein